MNKLSIQEHIENFTFFKTQNSFQKVGHISMINWYCLYQSWTCMIVFSLRITWRQWERINFLSNIKNLHVCVFEKVHIENATIKSHLQCP